MVERKLSARNERTANKAFNLVTSPAGGTFAISFRFGFRLTFLPFNFGHYCL
jgi:hypothetical protein